MYGVVQLSVWLWVRLKQMLDVDGADSVCCKRDLCRLLSLVLASLDNMSVLTFSVFGMCWMYTCSKAN